MNNRVIRVTPIMKMKRKQEKPRILCQSHLRHERKRRRKLRSGCILWQINKKQWSEINDMYTTVNQRQANGGVILLLYTKITSSNDTCRVLTWIVDAVCSAPVTAMQHRHDICIILLQMYHLFRNVWPITRGFVSFLTKMISFNPVKV